MMKCWVKATMLNFYLNYNYSSIENENSWNEKKGTINHTIYTERKGNVAFILLFSGKEAVEALSSTN